MLPAANKARQVVVWSLHFFFFVKLKFVLPVDKKCIFVFIVFIHKISLIDAVGTVQF